MHKLKYTNQGWRWNYWPSLLSIEEFKGIMLIQCSKIFNKLLVKLIEIFIILFSCYTGFPIYNQDAQNTTLNMKKNPNKQNYCTHNLKGSTAFWMLHYHIYINIYNTSVNTKVLNVVQHYGGALSALKINVKCPYSVPFILSWWFKM